MWKEISEELEESHFDDFEIEDDLHYRHPSINASIELRWIRIHGIVKVIL